MHACTCIHVTVLKVWCTWVSNQQCGFCAILVQHLYGAGTCQTATEEYTYVL